MGDKLIQYDFLAVNTIVKNKEGEVSSCDIRFTDDLEQFNIQYQEYTSMVAECCQDRDLSDECMVIGTDGAHAGKFLAILQEEINRLYK